MEYCQLCKTQFKVITNTHLKKKHSISIKDYKRDFPHALVGFTIKPNQLPSTDPRYTIWKTSLGARRSAWNKGKTKSNDSRVNKISQTFINNRIDNFRKWRKLKEEFYSHLYKPYPQDSNRAFLYGLILGDGNIHRFPRTDCLRIALGTDKPGLIKYAESIMQNVLLKKPTIYFSKTAACCYLTVYQRFLSERLEVPFGARSEVSINFPDWIWKEDVFLIACIKGLFEAEGSLSIHLRTYTYNFAFSNTNVCILNEVERALIKLGMHPERRKNAVRLRKKEEVKIFKQLISFRDYPLI